MPHTQNQPIVRDGQFSQPFIVSMNPQLASDIWEQSPERAKPAYVGIRQSEPVRIKAPQVAWWVYLVCILGAAATVVALVWLYSIAPIGGVR